MKDIYKLRAENSKILRFIDNCQMKNPYSKERLKAHNAKFKKEFNQFIKKNKFSNDTVKLFRLT